MKEGEQKWIKEKLAEMHSKEDVLNKEICQLDKLILKCQKRKKVLARMISKNMRHRNILIQKLTT